MTNIFKRILLSVCTWTLAGLSQAGGTEPCDYASVFEHAALNAFVLPYRVDVAQPTPDLQLAGRQISALVHLEVLMSLLKYSSIGAKDLLAQPGQVCDVDKVLARVSQPGKPGSLRRGQGLLMVWGRLFEQQGELYVQSYLRFVRQGATGPQPELLQFNAGAGDAQLKLSAGLPTQALAFAPRRISRAELARVDREFRQAMVLRPAPDAAAQGRSIDFSPHQAFSFTISEARGDWMLIKPTGGGPGGWVKARSQADDAAEQWSLQRWLPELAYVDGVAGFVRGRVGGLSETAAAGAARAMERGLARYERAVPAELAPAAWGLAAALRGWQAWERGQREEGAALFAQAQGQLPAYAGARQLAAVARLAAGRQALDGEATARFSRELMAALALAPQEGQVLRNMAQLYAVYEKKPEWCPFPPAELPERMAILQAALRP